MKNVFPYSLCLLIVVSILYSHPIINHTFQEGIGQTYGLQNDKNQTYLKFLPFPPEFSIMYPRNWSFTEYISRDNVVVFKPQSGAAGLGIYVHKLPVDYQNLSLQYKLDLYASSQLYYLKTHNFTIINFRPTSASPSLTLTLTREEGSGIIIECNNSSMVMSQLWTVLDDKVYGLIYVGTKGAYNNYLPTVNYMINSFMLYTLAPLTPLSESLSSLLPCPPKTCKFGLYNPT
jgi:hypothetical protein